ncbi:MAG: type II toxin-antitoxin system prevent-host-death family antitoxin [Chloroflexi bacterium]|nr:type II toxin-antitoxin system prevent-host-death family antitoxin [Chloroflexota bacterium]
MAVERKRFVVTQKGRRTAVLLPLREYQALLEDLEDLATIAERRDEPSEPWEPVKARLEKKWALART